MRVYMAQQGCSGEGIVAARRRDENECGRLSAGTRGVMGHIGANISDGIRGEMSHHGWEHHQGLQRRKMDTGSYASNST